MGVAPAALIGCFLSLCGREVLCVMVQNGWSLAVCSGRTCTSTRHQRPPVFCFFLSGLFFLLLLLLKHRLLTCLFPPPPLPCFLSPPLHSPFFVLRCCQQTQRNRGRCTVQPRIVRGGVSAPWWRPSSPCVHGTPAPNN